MNAMEIYDFDGPASGTTSTTADDNKDGALTSSSSAAATQPTLNEEVQQAIGTLGGLWGAFRKQGATALASARKDFGSVVQQAQRELEKRSAALTSPPATTTTLPNESPADSVTDNKETPAPAAATDGSTDAPSASDQSSSTANSSNPLFSFLQSNLPTNITQGIAAAPTNIQTTLQRTLATPEIQNLRSSITTNISSIQQSVQSNQQFQTLQSSVQNISLQNSVQAIQTNVATVQASIPANTEQVRERVRFVEGFIMEKGEEFWKGAGEFFKEAVKIVPPTEEELKQRELAGGGMLFDGSSVWMFDDLGGNGDADVDPSVSTTEKSKGKVDDLANQNVAVSRTAALLQKLRGDPELIRANPETGEGKDAFTRFLHELQEKGVEVGNEQWKAKCESEEGLFEDLRTTKAALVPSEIEEDIFWKRYWFRAWQIKQAEEKRKALLQATIAAEKEEDFNWEDDDDADSTPAPNSVKTQTPLDQSTETLTSRSHGKETSSSSYASASAGPEETQGKPTGTNSAKRRSTSAGSPRESEDSYDIVGTRSGNASGTALAAPNLATVKEKEKKKEDDDEEDEDEDEDEEEDEDEDEEGEEEEDSDWE